MQATEPSGGRKATRKITAHSITSWVINGNLACHAQIFSTSISHHGTSRNAAQGDRSTQHWVLIRLDHKGWQSLPQGHYSFCAWQITGTPKCLLDEYLIFQSKRVGKFDLRIFLGNKYIFIKTYKSVFEKFWSSRKAWLTHTAKSFRVCLCSGDDVDKISQEAQGAWRGNTKWEGVFRKTETGFYKYFWADVMCTKVGQFSELWTDLKFKTHSLCWGGSIVFPLLIYQVLWNHPFPTVVLSKNKTTPPPQKKTQQTKNQKNKTAAHTYMNSRTDLRQEHISKLGKKIPSPIINKEQREWRWAFWPDSKRGNLPIHLQNDARLQFL